MLLNIFHAICMWGVILLFFFILTFHPPHQRGVKFVLHFRLFLYELCDNRNNETR